MNWSYTNIILRSLLGVSLGALLGSLLGAIAWAFGGIIGMMLGAVIAGGIAGAISNMVVFDDDFNLGVTLFLIWPILLPVIILGRIPVESLYDIFIAMTSVAIFGAIIAALSGMAQGVLLIEPPFAFVGGTVGAIILVVIGMVQDEINKLSDGIGLVTLTMAFILIGVVLFAYEDLYYSKINFRVFVGTGACAIAGAIYGAVIGLVASMIYAAIVGAIIGVITGLVIKMIYKIVSADNNWDTLKHPPLKVATVQPDRHRRQKLIVYHSSVDMPLVQQLYNRLAQDSTTSHFFDVHLTSVAPRQAVEYADIIMVCFSQNSLAQRDYLQKKISNILEALTEQTDKTITLLTVRLDECEIPDPLYWWAGINLIESKSDEILANKLRQLEMEVKAQDKLPDSLNEAAPPPPAAVPPPPVSNKLVIFMIGMIIGIGFLYLSTVRPLVTQSLPPISTAVPSTITPSSPQVIPRNELLNNTNLVFSLKMILLALCISITPTFVRYLTRRQGRIARIVLETLLLLVIILSFSVWIFGLTVLDIWIIYAIALILLLEIGSHLVERYQIITLKRLSKGNFYSNIHNEAESIRQMFHSELALYIPIPLGLFLGSIVGLFVGKSQPEIIQFSLQIVLWTVSVALMLFLIIGFKRMINPLFDETQLISPDHITSAKVKEEKRGLKNLVDKVIEIFTSSSDFETQNQEQKFLDAAYIFTDLRKVYLYDAMHNVSLLVAFVIVAVSLWGVPIDTNWVIGSLIGMLILFNQVPFVLGQRTFHEKILEHYEGTRRADMAENLKKYAPLFPKSDLLRALFAGGTAGGLAYFLLDQFVKSAFK